MIEFQILIKIAPKFDLDSLDFLNCKSLKSNNGQQRLEGFKPSKRYTTLKINVLAGLTQGRFFHFNDLIQSKKSQKIQI
ncbi:MAG: hypothetical protein RL329_3611 [Bacteroidota bacterium]